MLQGLLSPFLALEQNTAADARSSRHTATPSLAKAVAADTSDLHGPPKGHPGSGAREGAEGSLRSPGAGGVGEGPSNGLTTSRFRRCHGGGGGLD